MDVFKICNEKTKIKITLSYIFLIQWTFIVIAQSTVKFAVHPE